MYGHRRRHVDLVPHDLALSPVLNARGATDERRDAAPLLWKRTSTENDASSTAQEARVRRSEIAWRRVQISSWAGVKSCPFLEASILRRQRGEARRYAPLKPWRAYSLRPGGSASSVTSACVKTGLDLRRTSSGWCARLDLVEQRRYDGVTQASLLMSRQNRYACEVEVPAAARVGRLQRLRQTRRR